MKQANRNPPNKNAPPTPDDEPEFKIEWDPSPLKYSGDNGFYFQLAKGKHIFLSSPNTFALEIVSMKKPKPDPTNPPTKFEQPSIDVTFKMRTIINEDDDEMTKKMKTDAKEFAEKCIRFQNELKLSYEEARTTNKGFKPLGEWSKEPDDKLLRTMIYTTQDPGVYMITSKFKGFKSEDNIKKKYYTDYEKRKKESPDRYPLPIHPKPFLVSAPISITDGKSTKPLVYDDSMNYRGHVCIAKFNVEGFYWGAYKGVKFNICSLVIGPKSDQEDEIHVDDEALEYLDYLNKKRKVEPSGESIPCDKQEHPGRIDYKDWVCPKCQSDPGDPDERGAAICSNDQCKETFHWCPKTEEFTPGTICH